MFCGNQKTYGGAVCAAALMKEAVRREAAGGLWLEGRVYSMLVALRVLLDQDYSSCSITGSGSGSSTTLMSLVRMALGNRLKLTFVLAQPL